MKTVLLILLLFCGALAAPLSAYADEGTTTFLDRIVTEVAPKNVREKVLLLARYIDSADLSIEQFADYYFSRVSSARVSPALRQRFIRNMRRNFAAIDRSGKGVVSASQSGERSIELVLYRLHKAASERRGVQPQRTSSGGRS